MVIAEQPSYIFTPWKLSAHFTDQEGKADIASDNGHVFSKSHHILLNGLEKETVKLYSLGKPKTKGIKEKTISIVDDLNNRKMTHAIFLPICKDTNISFYPQNGTFLANSENENLIRSSKFHFEKGNIAEKSSQLKSLYGELVFYCQTNNNFNKVSLKQLSLQPIPNQKRKLLITIKITSLKNTTLDTYIEPTQIKKIDEKTFRTRPLSEKYKPSIKTDKDIKEKLKNFNKELPEGNEHTQVLFDYVLRAVELNE